MIPMKPSRAEIWLANLDPPVGHEQGGTRPCLIVSDDGMNHGPLGLAIVVPLTSVEKGFPSHVEVMPPEGGLTLQSYIKCEDVRSISQKRLIKRVGIVSPSTMRKVTYRLRLLLHL